jgi:hypothetical protein
LAPKFDMLAAGKDVEFTKYEQERWDMLAASFPSYSLGLEQAIMTASREAF